MSLSKAKARVLGNQSAPTSNNSSLPRSFRKRHPIFEVDLTPSDPLACNHYAEKYVD